MKDSLSCLVRSIPDSLSCHVQSIIFQCGDDLKSDEWSVLTDVGAQKTVPALAPVLVVGTITKNSKRDIVRSQFLQWRELGLVLVIIGLGRWSIPLTKWKKEEEEEIGYC